MKRDIILSGVGGQGILSIAAVIGRAALEDGLHIKQAEVHGMSQRGGDVQSNLRISSSAIRSDLIPRGAADLIVSMEPMEALRYLPWLADDGWVITGITPLINIPNYPEGETLRRELEKLPHAVVLDAVHAIVHGFQDVHVVSLVEIIGMFCIGHRIEIDAGQVRPEGIGNAVDVFTKDNSFDAFFLGHGFQDFLLFHNSSFTRQRRCRRLLVL